VLLLFAIVFVAAVAVALLTNNDEGAGSDTIDTVANRATKGGATPTPALQISRTEATSGKPQATSWTVTAYCPCRKCCGPTAHGVTASGTRADHPLAAGPPEMLFGTVLDIPGYGLVRCEDRGGAIRGRRLDVLMPTHAEALAWGVKRFKISSSRFQVDGRKGDT
jgi:3D (Asp-Asp-Asp) domain-containing protein